MMILGKERGAVLVLAVILLVLLTALGIWAVSTSTTEVKISAYHKGYEQAFSLADGGCNVAYGFQRTNPLPITPQAYQLVEFPSDQLPSYMQTHQTDTGTYTPKLYYYFSPTPPAGWELNKGDYYPYYTLLYKALGRGDVSTFQATSSVSLWVMKVPD